MQKLLSWMLGGAGDYFASREVQDAVDQLIAQVEPRVKLLSGGARQLRRGVRLLLAHLHEIGQHLPPPLDLSPAGYSSDRRVGLLFASPQSLCDSLRASEAIGHYLASPQAPEQMLLILSMQLREDTRLGSQLLPDGSVRGDVPQRVLSFDRHRFIAASGDHDTLLLAARQQAFALLCRSLASGVAQTESQRRLLEVERQALQLQLHNKTHVLNAQALNLHGSMSHEQMAVRLAQVEGELAATQQVASLQGKLALMRQVIEQPQLFVQASSETAWLDRMGIVLGADQGGQQLDYANIEMGYLQKRRRVVFAAKLSRSDLREWQQRWPALES
jgi:hypothetical protein